MKAPLPEDAQERKEYPMYRGLICYFPKALAAVAHRSYEGGKQHGHDELHWDRNKSSDDADAVIRHITEGDWPGAAWRALACLEKHLEGQDLSVLKQPPIVADNATTVAAEATEDDWIDWYGGEHGEPDLPEWTKVYVRRYDGTESELACRVDYWHWHVVTAYKIAEPDITEGKPEDWEDVE